ncbi:MAG: peptidoglycan editing factor PgeF [Actinobacteria bacterium]|nr:peptidoglycan editing factor PgeF [Actinomycetota bacterium]
MLEVACEEKRKLPVINFPFMEKYGIFCGFTSRSGGLSRNGYRHLNLAYHVGENTGTVYKNRRLVLDAIGSASCELLSSRQVHGNNIIHIGSSIENHGGDIPIEADCLITGRADTPLMVMGADCSLILIADIEKKIIAALHAGWKGTFEQLTIKVLDYLKDRFKCRAHDMLAFIGPCIRKCCYTVGQDMIKNFSYRFGNTEHIITGKQRHHLDLAGLNISMLVNGGLSPGNIRDCNICSCCDERFYSYRRNKTTGRHGAIIEIRS